MTVKKPFLIILLSTLLLFAITTSAKSGEKDLTQKEAEALKSARQTTDAMLKEYKKSLLQKGSIENALTRCIGIGGDIAKDYSLRTGYVVKRTSLGYRNPDNKPTDTEERILKRFSKLNQEGKIKKGHESHSIIEEGKVKYLLYMRPLVTGRLCINCHGKSSDISPDTSRLIKEAYPDDKATGFEVGDIRGAVTIKIPLEVAK